MGNWYTNIAMKGVDAADVLRSLQKFGRRAIVNPEQGGWVTVFDEECDKFDLDVLESLALTLSTELNCCAFPSFNADDDVLWLGIYENGQRAARYASDLSQFEDGAEFPPAREFAQRICELFGKPDASGQVGRILGKSHGALGFFYPWNVRLAYLFEIHRHMDLARVLLLPSATVGLGFRYVSRGDLAEGMQAERLLKTFGRVN